MGFTFSHPAMVVPLAAWLPLSALVAGSMAPDMVLIGSLPLAHHYGHVWPGLLLFSLPVALLLYLGFHLLAKWPLLALCPPAMRIRLSAPAAAGSGTGARPVTSLVRALQVVAALVLGIGTHYLWDTVTHRAGWKPEILTRTLHQLFGLQPIYEALQIGTSVVGLGLLGYWLRAWLLRAPIGADAPGLWSERTRIALLTLAMLLAPLVVLARIAAVWQTISGADEILTVGGLTFMRFCVCALFAYCCLWWARAASGLPAERLRAGMAALLFLPEFGLALNQPTFIDNFDFEARAVEVWPGDSDDLCHITGMIGDGWQDNSAWADVDVDYSIDHQNPHGGQADQVVNVTRVDGGAVQFAHRRHFQAHVGLRCTVWLRGDDGMRVSLVLQQAKDPWRTCGFVTVTLAPQWQEFHVVGVPQNDGLGVLGIRAKRPGRFAIDDVRIEESAPAAP